MTSVDRPNPGVPNGDGQPLHHSDASADALGPRAERPATNPALGRLAGRQANAAGQEVDGSERRTYSLQEITTHIEGLVTAALDELWNTPRSPFSEIVGAHQTFHRSLAQSGDGRDSDSVDRALDAVAEAHGIRHPMDHLLLLDTLYGGHRSEPAPRADLEAMTGAYEAVSQGTESADDAMTRLGISHSLDQNLLKSIERQVTAKAAPPLDTDVLRRAQSTVTGDSSGSALLTVAILFGVRREEQVRALYDVQARHQIQSHAPTITNRLNGADGHL